MGSVNYGQSLHGLHNTKSLRTPALDKVKIHYLVEKHQEWHHCFKYQLHSKLDQKCTESEIFDSNSTLASAEYILTPKDFFKF